MGVVSRVHCRDLLPCGLVWPPLDDVGVANKVEVPRLEAFLSDIVGLLA